MFGNPRYARCYCEENVRLLCDHPRLKGVEAYAVFISNPAKSVLMWGSRTVRDPRSPVNWDYHVILTARLGSWIIYDFDFRGSRPCAPNAWLMGSFPHLFAPLMGDFEGVVFATDTPPLFKLIPIADYRERFSSSRNHMRRPDGSWLTPPPEWAPIGTGPDTLPRFWDMANAEDGQIMDFTGLVRFFYADEDTPPSFNTD